MARLKTRLEKLEHATAIDFLSAMAEKLFVSLLGRRDALFFPTRTHGSRVAIVQKQRAYLNGTEGIASKADGQGQWKDAHYARAELVRRGLVTANSSGGQITSMFMTPQGDALAKSLVWDCPALKSLNEVNRELFQRLRDFDVKPWCGRKWVSEGSLFNMRCTGNPDDWIDFTELLLPLLVSGLVTSNADNYGRLYYYALDTTFPVIEATEFPGIANQLSTDIYLAAYHSERRALETAKPADDSEVAIPIPASGW